jgi:microcystin-dependent protein
LAKLTLSAITSGYASVAAINAAFDAIETAMENTLSRDGTSPNAMGANLDMNSNRILNLPVPVADDEPITKGYGDDTYGAAASAAAEESADEAAASATAAAASAAAAATSATAAATAETNAETAETNAEAAQAAAEAAQVAAELAANSVMWNDVVFKTAADSPISITNADKGKLYAIDCTAGAVTVNLPAISGLTLGQWSVGFRKTDAGVNAITINRNGTDTIDGSASISLATAGLGKVLVPDADPAPDIWTSMTFGADIPDGSVTTAKIADSNVTAAKLDPGLVDDLSTVTPTTSDYLVLGDASDSNNIKRALISELSALLFSTGMTMSYAGATAPTGWVLLSGRTIGSASSGATERANDDTQNLFTQLWNDFADAQCAVSGGRGASAAADWAANKTIALPDARGRTLVGKDDMGGTTASRITNGGSGITGTTLGISGGAETHTLTSAQMPVHSHGVSDPSHAHSTPGSTGGGGNVPYNAFNHDTWGGTAGAGTGISIQNAGSGNAHNNTQPSLVLNVICKL